MSNRRRPRPHCTPRNRHDGQLAGLDLRHRVFCSGARVRWPILQCPHAAMGDDCGIGPAGGARRPLLKKSRMGWILRHGQVQIRFPGLVNFSRNDGDRRHANIGRRRVTFIPNNDLRLPTRKSSMYIDHSTAAMLPATSTGSLLSTVFICALVLGAMFLYSLTVERHP